MNILFPGELNYSGEDLFFCGGELKGGELSFQGRTYFWRAGGEHKKKPMAGPRRDIVDILVLLHRFLYKPIKICKMFIKS